MDNWQHCGDVACVPCALTQAEKQNVGGMPDPAFTVGIDPDADEGSPKIAATAPKTLDDMPSLLIREWVESTGFRKDEITETHDDGSITKTTVETTGVIDAAAVDRLVKVIEQEGDDWQTVLGAQTRQRNKYRQEVAMLRSVNSLTTALCESMNKAIVDQKREIEILRSLIKG